MALMRWNPWSGLYSLQREMDLLMRRLNGDWPAFAASGSEAWVPAVDVFHRDEDLVIRAELPGIDPEKDVEITAPGGCPHHPGRAPSRGPLQPERRGADRVGHRLVLQERGPA
jgi:hypothetical protein